MYRRTSANSIIGLWLLECRGFHTTRVLCRKGGCAEYVTIMQVSVRVMVYRKSGQDRHTYVSRCFAAALPRSILVTMTVLLKCNSSLFSRFDINWAVEAG